jgi:DNA-directed RNA polymerase subunit RPC12/RpoP
MLKKFGALPFIGIALLAGVFMAGRYSAKETPDAAPADKPAGKTVPTGFISSLFKAVGGNGTQATLYRSDDIYQPEMTMGMCLYCHAGLAISGDKGSDSIRCPNCGGTMTALKAILYLDYSIKQVH